MRVLRILLACLLLYFDAAMGQTFKKHRIGESAQEFSTVATLRASEGNTSEYCRRYLNDPNVMRAYQKIVKNSTDLRALKQSQYVTGCWDVKDALEGKDVSVGALYATEIGQGNATFHAFKLVVMSFTVPRTSIEDVVTDITAELGHVEPVMSVQTLENGFGATLQERRAVWQTDTLFVSAAEMKSFEYGSLGIAVEVADKQYLNKKEQERQTNRPNTIR